MSNENPEQGKRTYSSTEIYSHSVLSAALTINNIHGRSLDLDALVGSICEQTKSLVVEGNIRSIEITLATQAKTLGVLFHRMTTMAMEANSLEQMQGLAEIGLKAQKQCRQTLSALADLKEPRRTTFVKQQNVAVNQQINNANQEQNSEILEKSPNELLSEGSHEALDAGRTTEAISIDPQLETVVPRERGGNP